jgi:hypothetical protein
MDLLSSVSGLGVRVVRLRGPLGVKGDGDGLATGLPGGHLGLDVLADAGLAS